MATPGRPPLERSELEPIFDAVLEVASTYTSRRATLQQIATSAGVSVGKLQHHFGTRDNLVRQAFEHHLLSITKMLGALRDMKGSATQRLSRLVDEVTQHRSWMRSTLWIDLLNRSIDSVQYRHSAQEIYRAWVEMFTELIKEGVEASEFHPATSAVDAATIIVSMADGLTVLVIVDGEESLDAERQQRRALLASVVEATLGIRL